ncbi:MAG: hypothetical protein QOJ89_730 [bacterium]|jgi:signal transduction histidine kinase
MTLVALIGVAGAIAAAAIAATSTQPGDQRDLTYAAASAGFGAVDVIAGVGLLVGGAVAATQGRTRRLGLLAILISIAWFGADLDGWERGPALVRSLGEPAALFIAALLLHLAFALPGRRPPGLARAAIAAGYLTAIVVSVGRALLRDPLLDLYCWSNCRVNSFLVHAMPGTASTLADVWRWSTATIAVVIVGTGVRRLASATVPARRALAPLLLAVMFAAGAQAAYVVALMRTPLEDPTRTGFRALFLARGLTLITLALAIAWSALRVRIVRARVSGLATELHRTPPPGTLATTLAVAVGDASLELLFPLSPSGRVVDSAGVDRAAPSTDHTRAITQIVRGGRPVAFVVHDAALVGEGELEREFGSAARLALENEALRAEVLTQLTDLGDSRARIVATGDAARRVLERDLHDGAQQRLLAALFDLELARQHAEHDCDTELASLIATAAEQLDLGFAELRELAHGIHPAILTEGGLRAALATFAETAPIAVRLAATDPGRLAETVETGAYAAVAEAVRDAAARGARLVSIEVLRSGNVLRLTIEDDGSDHNRPPVHLSDRVGALAGSVEINGTTLRAEIPCA